MNLPLRTHKEFIRHAVAVEEVPNDAEQERRTKFYGINGVPLLAKLSSLSFPESFPHDLMHIVENIIPMLLDHWTGTFKDLDGDPEEYELPCSVADVVGKACAKLGSTIPSAFGAHVPNIAKDCYQCTAESWFLFGTLLGPAVLYNLFSRRCYYNHFVQLVMLIIKCLQFELSSEEICEIESGFAAWVQKYEHTFLQSYRSGGKFKRLGGGDLIDAWDMVSAYHTAPDSVRDATFIKFTLEVDKNANFPNLPVILKRKAYFGQVWKFIALTVPPKFPIRHDAGEEEHTESARERTIVLAAIADTDLIRYIPSGIGCFDAKSSDLGPPSQVIDVESIDCLAGHIRVGKQWACLLRPEVAAKFKLVAEGSGDLDEGTS
ncbi:hypothetical protein DFH08DRAFT_953876 [Mycena albidolilacea]|uniref:Uncharacterized protein n=1 Tax=Mycena albidolilacea TaxID=1033008 RepID=A0AAD7EWT6_9AGAR|nr:hypothetical protein DFH08DRAFT_953876 [Mycena albidolilacea]